MVEVADDDYEDIGAVVVPANNITKLSLKIDNVHLWNGLEDPFLYCLNVKLVRHNEVLDNVELNHGIREYYVDPDKGFFLNGKSLPLRGVSRHQDRLGKGNALDDMDHFDDLDLILNIGANSVRLAHYQQDDYFYELCDRYGLIVWAEIPFISRMNKDAKAHENAMEQMKELIYQNYNHSSICFWGISNEITIAGDIPGLTDNLRELDELVKSIDKTRLTTMAQVSMLPMDSDHNQITDILAYNLYFGWYGGKYTDNEVWFDKFRAMHPNRAVGLSEYGCEGIISWHSNTPECKDYTEEYQAEYHEHMAKLLAERPEIWGSYVWNMFDFGCDARDEGGVKGRNNKGMVTFDRKIKKDAFYLYKAYWSDDYFAHITGKRYALRHQNVIDIKVYSNIQKDNRLLKMNNKIRTKAEIIRFLNSYEMFNGMKVEYISTNISKSLKFLELKRLNEFIQFDFDLDNSLKQEVALKISGRGVSKTEFIKLMSFLVSELEYCYPQYIFKVVDTYAK